MFIQESVNAGWGDWRLREKGRLPDCLKPGGGIRLREGGGGVLASIVMNWWGGGIGTKAKSVLGGGSAWNEIASIADISIRNSAGAWLRRIDKLKIFSERNCAL